MAALTVAEIASLCGGEFQGDGQKKILGANSLDMAGIDDLSFVANQAALEMAEKSGAGCLITRTDSPLAGPWSLIRTADPRAAFARALAGLYPPPVHAATRDASAIIAPDAQLADNVFIGALVTIGRGASIASGCSIGNGCVIGEEVRIGPGTTLHARVVLYPRVRIGARVVLHSGCVIGADGFGFVRVGERYEKFPQIGTVLIEDDVEIGANTCIDRGALGQTTIGQGSKLDNLIHVAHNVRIGRHVVIAAQTGFSGGVIVGDGAVIGGQVGMGDKAHIEGGAVVGSGSGILTRQTVKAGEPVWGTPARPLRQHLKGLAHISRLGAYRAEIKALQQRLRSLEAHLAEERGG